MDVVRGIDQFPKESGAIQLAIGMFDGVHLGHQSVIEACKSTALNDGGKSAVLSFWPHPSKLLRPDHAVPQIMPLSSKLWSLEKLGLDYTIIQDFNEGFAKISAREFVPYLKTHIPTLRTLFVGQNFRYGRGREGDVEQLRNESNELDIHVVSMEACKIDGTRVSSTRIRKLLQNGEFNSIKLLLGHPYTVRGKTIQGRQVGRKIGYPTLNIDWVPELPPPFGVYAARTIAFRDGKRCCSAPGVANYGIRPTYDLGSDPILEIHLFETCTIGYDTEVAVELVEFLRPEQKFDSQGDLVAQISKDVAQAKKVLGAA
jgi:riboflavin kinase/FMN adenylyltransferase